MLRVLAAVAVVLSLVPGVVYEAKAQPSRCEELFSLVEQLDKYHRKGGSGSGLLDGLSRNPNFQKYLKTTNIQWHEDITDHTKTAIVSDYLGWLIESYTPERLAELRNESLIRSLQAHGVIIRRGSDGSPGNGLKALEEQSATNVSRFLDGKAYERSLEMIAVEKLVAKHLRFTFIHNSNFDLKTDNAEVPVLSSRQLLNVGLGGGLNSMATFNREIIRSDDNVFFEVYPANPSEGSLAGKNGFGSKGFHIDAEYASKHGWISAYVMIPDELLAIANQRNPNLFNNIGSFVTRSMGRRNELAEMHAIALMDASSYLRDYDFTVADFEHLSRQLVLSKLDNLRKTDKPQFEATVSDMAEGKLELLWKHWRTEMLAAGLPSRMEFKVPVLVHKEALRRAP